MKAIKSFLIISSLMLFASCYQEDPGPRQPDNRSFAMVDFDRVEAGDALVVTITQGNEFLITASGDRRNLDDLKVEKIGNTLFLHFIRSQRRQYETYINISMPALNGVVFSGAINGRVEGFNNIGLLDLTLSGASLAQTNISADKINLSLSGASQLRLSGAGTEINGTVSGASLLSAFEYPINNSKLIVSGASNCRVTVSNALDVNASGASVILYRGNPQLNIESSGESVIRHD
jgi:hypothetical protein